MDFYVVLCMFSYIYNNIRKHAKYNMKVHAHNLNLLWEGVYVAVEVGSDVCGCRDQVH